MPSVREILIAMQKKLSKHTMQHTKLLMTYYGINFITALHNSYKSNN